MHIYSLSMSCVALKTVRKSLGARSGDLNRIEFDEHAYVKQQRGTPQSCDTNHFNRSGSKHDMSVLSAAGAAYYVHHERTSCFNYLRHWRRNSVLAEMDIHGT